jgi:hypothetical protein
MLSVTCFALSGQLACRAVCAADDVLSLLCRLRDLQAAVHVEDYIPRKNDSHPSAYSPDSRSNSSVAKPAQQ